MPRRRAVCQGESLNQDWRTGTLLIRLNLDIHKFWNVIMPYSKNFIGGNVHFVKFCSRGNFEGIKTNGCQEFEFIVFTV